MFFFFFLYMYNPFVLYLFNFKYKYVIFLYIKLKYISLIFNQFLKFRQQIENWKVPFSRNFQNLTEETNQSKTKGRERARVFAFPTSNARNLGF